MPREEDQLADFISRIMDCDDGGINKEVFQWLDNLWGPHSINSFANNHNRQTERYYSRFYDLGSTLVVPFDPLSVQNARASKDMPE